MPRDEDLGPLLPRKDAARYLCKVGVQTTAQTLARKFCDGTGPLCTKVNRRALYYRKHLDDWRATQVSPPRRRSTER